MLLYGLIGSQAYFHSIYSGHSCTSDWWLFPSPLAVFLLAVCFAVAMPIWMLFHWPSSPVRRSCLNFQFSGTDLSSVNSLCTSSTKSLLAIADRWKRRFHIELYLKQIKLQRLKFFLTAILSTVPSKRKIAGDTKSIQFCLNCYQPPLHVSRSLHSTLES